MIPKFFSLTLIAMVLSAGTTAQTAPLKPTLKDAFKSAFLVGVAINRQQIYGEDKRGDEIVKAQFNSITPENVLKWALVHPQLNVYDFSAADRYVEFGKKNHMFIIGHTLIWHNQTPKWVFEDEKGNPVTPVVLLRRMRDHIHKVVKRYRGKIKGWDVVNEAVNDDGTLRQSPWMKIIGEDYLVKAFQYAHEADPKAELYYNDFALENEPKRKGAIALIKKLQAAGIPVKAIGLQGHDHLDWPTLEQQDETIRQFAELGIKVNITELDITVLPSSQKQNTAEVTARAETTTELNPYTNGLPDSVQQALTKRYADLFSVFAKHRDAIDRVTFWGVTDADSWRNDWPAKGRTDYPLLFDRKGEPKPAFEAVIGTAKVESATSN